MRTLGLHYAKTQKNHARARNSTNYSADANFLNPKPKPFWSEIRVRRNRERQGPIRYVQTYNEEINARHLLKFVFALPNFRPFL